MSNIQIRIDDKTKKKAKRILDDLGLDMSTAIKIYLKQIVQQEGIPLKIFTKNGFTPVEEDDIIKAAQEARKGENITKAMNVKEAIEYLKSL